MKQFHNWHIELLIIICYINYGDYMKHEILMECPEIIRNFLTYSESIKGKSSKSVDEYYIDLRTFFRYIKMIRGLVPSSLDFEKIKIDDVEISLIKTISISDLYSFLVYCKNERGNSAATRARKTSTLRIFFKYLTSNVHLLDTNPALELETPKLAKTLPSHLTLEESIDLLNTIDGPFKERDYCIITLFLNCGMRLSELCGLNLTDIYSDNSIKIRGKGNKERIVFLNEACLAAVKNYLEKRPVDGVPSKDKNALFLSKRRVRISNKTVQYIVYKNLEKCGLSGRGLSTHKLRHTAATLMYQQGHVDVRVLKDVLGHANLNTTQIYTHVSNEQVKEAIETNPLAKIKIKANNEKKATE